MVKIKLYKNFFGNISFIMVENFFCSSNALRQLIDIFNPKHLITTVAALDRESAFYKFVSNEEHFKILLPSDDTITSETVIMSSISDFLSVFNLLLRSEPRYITLYEPKESIDIFFISNKSFHYSDDILVSKNYADFVISMILEECCMKITFNTNVYQSSYLFKTIKDRLKAP